METTKKHEQIMQAAAAVFAKYGYKKTTVDEIVAAAGISKGLFYHYYKDKKELYLHLYDTYVDLLSHNINEKVNVGETDFFERLRQITRIRLSFIRQYPDLWGFLYTAYYEEHPDVAEAVAQKNKDIIDQSKEGSAAGIDWSKLKKNITPRQALDMVTWIAEGYVKQVNAKKLAADEDCYKEFDAFLEILKNGMYNEERKENAIF